MKKNFVMTSVFMLSLLLAACSGKEDALPVEGNETENIETDNIQSVVEAPLQVITINDDTSAVITESDFTEDEEQPLVYEEIYDPVGKVYSVDCASSEEVTLGFVGDVGFAEGYATINTYRSKGSDITKCLDAEILDIMRGVDIMMANNEFPYSYRGSPTPNKTYTFRADPADVQIMKDMGVDIVSLANNHAYDYGPDALIDTVDTLNDAKLPFVGAGKNMEEAKKPAYFHVNGHIVSFVSATQIERYSNPDTKEATEDSPGVLRTLDPAKAVAAIEEAAANSDFTIMYVHWGSESTDLVEQSQRDLAKAYVEAGADLIIGDHSHCLQGIDYVEGVPVFYSLGNYWFNSRTLDTCIVRVSLDKECKIKSIEFIPALQTGSCVRIGDGDNYDRILEYMRGISDYAQIDENGFVTEDSVSHNIQNGQNTSPAKKKETTVQSSEESQTDAAQSDAEAAQALMQQLLEAQALQAGAETENQTN